MLCDGEREREGDTERDRDGGAGGGVDKRIKERAKLRQLEPGLTNSAGAPCVAQWLTG